MDSLSEDVDQASTPKKMRSSGINGQEEMTVLIKSENRGGQRQKGKKILGLHRIAQKWLLQRFVISFSVSVKALVPHHVSE